MIEVKRNFSLKPYNTFGVSAFAKAYISTTTQQQLREALGYCHDEPIFLLGGGSNMLLLNDLDRTVIHLNLKGISVRETTDGKVLVTAQAGENWHQFVSYCIDRNYAGLENLSLIPGNVGTAPIQNIGAYGVEIKDVFHRCEAVHIKTGKTRIFTLSDCKFGYRNSIFKGERKNQYVITNVTFELANLNHTEHYDFKITYGAIQSELEKMKADLNLRNVAQAVINIRKSKLPDPAIIGNGGSFFKNPIVARSFYEDLVRMHPTIPSYKVDENLVKIPAGWLIEHAGLKGKRWGDAGVHDRQALVLVNHANATGKQIMNVALLVQEKVQERFGIHIEMEVNAVEG
ncbi:MAG: UDP-N-acetylmuramate dehydrogenase [Nonlabens sp.]